MDVNAITVEQYYFGTKMGDYFTFLHYDETTDTSLILPLSEHLYDYLVFLGYTPVSKLGQGSGSTTFLTNTYKGDQVAVVIRIGERNGNTYSQLNLVHALQQSGKLKTHHTIRVIGSIIYHGVGSDDPVYQQGLDISSQTVVCDVLELASYTVSELIYSGITRDVDTQTKVNNIYTIMTELKKILVYLDKLGLKYDDLLMDNVGFRGSDFVLIDVKTLRLKKDTANIRDKMIWFYSDLTSLYTEPDELDILSMSWKWVNGYMTDNDERNAVIQTLNPYIEQLLTGLT